MSGFPAFGILLPPGAAGDTSVPCPQCSAQRRKPRAKCLSVHVEKGVWNCHHCGWRGTLKSGIERQPSTRITFRRPEPVTATPADAARAWLHARGITDAVIARNRVGMLDAWIPQTESHERCVVFPYYRDGELINHKYRDVKQKYFRLERDAELVLYGYDDIDPACTVIVEGELDKLACEVAGLRAVVSVPNGAPSARGNETGTFCFLNDLPEVATWVIAVDDDEPGRHLAAEIVRRFGAERCRQVTWPAGCKDANDVLLAHSAQTLRACIDAAPPVPISGVFTAQDRLGELKDLWEHGLQPGVLIGPAALDRLYSVTPGQLTVVTGHPHSGKSHFVDYALHRLALQHGWHVGVFSPENLPLEVHMARYVERILGQPFSNAQSRAPWADVEQAVDILNGYVSWIAPDEDEDWNIETILAKAAALVARKGIRALTIDPYNELEHQRPAGLTETEYVGLVLKRIKQFARKHAVHVFLVVHPRIQYRGKDGHLPELSLYDISGSAHFYNKTDNGLILYREHNTVRVVVAKVRFRETGMRGECALVYDPASSLYV